MSAWNRATDKRRGWRRERNSQMPKTIVLLLLTLQLC